MQYSTDYLGSLHVSQAMKDRKLAQNALQSFQRLFRESEVFLLTDLQNATEAFIAADFVDEFVVGCPSNISQYCFFDSKCLVRSNNRSWLFTAQVFKSSRRLSSTTVIWNRLMILWGDKR